MRVINRPRVWMAWAAVSLAVAVSAGARYGPAVARVLSRNPASVETTEPVAPAPELVKEVVAIRRGDTLGDLLDRAGLEPAARLEVTDAVALAFDVKKFRAGTQLTFGRTDDGVIEEMEYIVDPDHALLLSRPEGTYKAEVVEIPGTVGPATVCGTLQGSLFESIERIGERAELALGIAEIFAWDLDFYTDPREGDEFCVLVEKKEYANGQQPTYQRILAAEYRNAGTLFDAYQFGDEGRPQYYSRDGRSLQSAFLRSPLRFEARISSRFSLARRHPILKIVRPHLGTDYAAPTGTPVQAIASGQVIFAGRSGGAGNLIKIRHSGSYETQYMHLSRILVRRGQRVEQGQRIGLVGATGLATGPHLDFRMLRNGSYVNFERLRPPPASRIAAAQMAEFQAARDGYLGLIAEGKAIAYGGPPKSADDGNR